MIFLQRWTAKEWLIGWSALFGCLLCMIGVLFYQVWNRPLPVFTAVAANGSQVTLTPFQEPNLLPNTLLRWASKATVTAYTFDFVNYADEFAAARGYFTDAGWKDFKSAIADTLDTVIKNQLFVTGVITGAPVISNQGPLPDQGYVVRVQIPFLVTYQSANVSREASYIVILSIVQVPTSQNPQGIGIDQFIMVGA